MRLTSLRQLQGSTQRPSQTLGRRRQSRSADEPVNRTNGWLRYIYLRCEGTDYRLRILSGDPEGYTACSRIWTGNQDDISQPDGIRWDICGPSWFHLKGPADTVSSQTQASTETPPRNKCQGQSSCHNEDVSSGTPADIHLVVHRQHPNDQVHLCSTTSMPTHARASRQP